MKIIFLDFELDKVIFENTGVDMQAAILLPKEGEYVHFDDVMYLVKTVHFKYSISASKHLMMDHIIINLRAQ